MMHRHRRNRRLRGLRPYFRSTEDEGTLGDRLEIPGFWYDAVADTYFRRDQYFHPMPIAPPPPTARPPLSMAARRSSHALGVLDRLSQGRLNGEDRLRFVLGTVSIKPDLSVEWTALRRPEQVLVHKDGCNMIIINHLPMLDSVQFVGQRLEWRQRTRPHLTSLAEFHRCSDGLSAAWAGPRTIDGDPILVTRNPKFAEINSATITFMLVDVKKWSAFQWWRVSTQDLRARSKARFLSDHIVCSAWSAQHQKLFVGGDQEVAMYSVQDRATTLVGREKACSLAVNDSLLFAGGQATIRLFDIRCQDQLKSPTAIQRLSGNSVVKQLTAIKDGRYLLAEDAVGTVHQSDVRNLKCAVATMHNRTADCLSFVPFELDETEDILTSSIPGHGAHVWDLRKAELLRCIPVEEGLVNAVFKRQWDSVLLFCRDAIKVAPLC